MLPLIGSFALGILFAIGLAVSEMIDPARVIGFLDVAGKWDATLLCVMGGALAVTVPLFPWILRCARPLLDRQFSLPTKRTIDRPLILGAASFGIGWGLGGFCPGPALAGLASGAPSVLMFVVSMFADITLHGRTISGQAVSGTGTLQIDFADYNGTTN